MQIHISGEECVYDGSQLSSHFCLKRFGIVGDSIVVFKGPMNIHEKHVADMEDLLDEQKIRSGMMLHLIAELFGTDLEGTVLKQRLLIRLAKDILEEKTGKAIEARGDDLFHRGKKLSVSVAAPSPVSCMIHFGINISTEDVPVEAACLKDLGVSDPAQV